MELPSQRTFRKNEHEKVQETPEVLWVCVCICVFLTPSQLGWFCTDIQRFINSSNHILKTQTHTHKLILKLYHTHTHTHTPEAELNSFISNFPKHELILSSVYSGGESDKMKWKNRVLKMMYCGNWTEATYESKKKSREKPCKRTNTVKNALRTIKSFGGVTVTEKEMGGRDFPSKQNITKTKRARRALIISDPNM